MEDTQTRRHEMLMRVRVFFAEHIRDFSPSGLAPGLFDDLGEIVTQLSGLASTEVSGRGSSRQGTSTRATAREALKDDLEAINRTARAISIDIPGFKERFRLPRGNNDQELIQFARAFAAEAVPFSDRFIAHEMPADFLDDLNADIANMDTAIRNQSSGKGDYIEAGVAIDETIDAGLVIVRKLDAIVRNRYADNPGALAEWNSASHTERSPRRSKPTAPPPPPAGVGSEAPPSQ